MSRPRVSLLLALPLALGGCGVYVVDDEFASPGGIYDGAAFVEGGFGGAHIVGAVTEFGEGRFVDEDGRAYVAFVPDRTFFDGSITLHDRDGRASGPFSGVLTERFTLDGDFHVVSNQTGFSRAGSLELDNDAFLYDTPSDPFDLAGSWATDDSSAVFTFDPDGSVFGQDASGCTYSGEFFSADLDTSLYRVEVEVNCDGFVEFWDGLAAPTHAFVHDAVFLSISGGGTIFAAVLF